MEDWYDNGIGSEKMKRDIAKSAKENPITFPCLDPEGCKHFKAQIDLQDEVVKLREAMGVINIMVQRPIPRKKRMILVAFRERCWQIHLLIEQALKAKHDSNS